VSRILFDRITHAVPTAIGIELKTGLNSQVYQVHAKREVVLCSGTVNTPQTLMLSGVGPAEELKKHGIAPVKENSNVGQHLKDHLTSGAMLCRAKPGTTLDYLNSQVYAIPALLRWDNAWNWSAHKQRSRDGCILSEC
jgi:choline dehydrogenase